MQAEVIRQAKRLALSHPGLSEMADLFSVPNGARVGQREALKLKAEGMTAGVADLLLLVPRGGYHGLAIEMKTPSGRVRPEQTDWLIRHERRGYLVAVCRKVSDAVELLTRYLTQGVS